MTKYIRCLCLNKLLDDNAIACSPIGGIKFHPCSDNKLMQKTFYTISHSEDSLYPGYFLPFGHQILTNQHDRSRGSMSITVFSVSILKSRWLARPLSYNHVLLIGCRTLFQYMIHYARFNCSTTSIPNNTFTISEP